MHRPARSIWPVLFFLLGFTLLVTVVSHYFLIPALLATRDATPAEKRHISAVATLLLAVVLIIISVGLILVLRVRRFFVATPPERVKTQYVDAWAEAGKRAEIDPDDKDEDDDREKAQ